jgi:hypothetical protein
MQFFDTGLTEAKSYMLDDLLLIVTARRVPRPVKRQRHQASCCSSRMHGVHADLDGLVGERGGGRPPHQRSGQGPPTE